MIVIRKAEAQHRYTQFRQPGAKRVMLREFGIPMRQQHNRAPFAALGRKPHCPHGVVFREWRLNWRSELEPFAAQLEIGWFVITEETAAIGQSAPVQFQNVVDWIAECARLRICNRPSLCPLNPKVKWTDNAVGSAKAKPVLPIVHPSAVETASRVTQTVHVVGTS